MGPLLTAMGLTFIAELGDKTQLLAVGLGARHRFGVVLMGLALGFATSSALAVGIGSMLGDLLDARVLSLASGAVFLVFAIWTLRPTTHDEAEAAADAAAGRSTSTAIVSTVALGIVVAELGDKTMLTTTALATQGNALQVWAGATLGEVASCAVGLGIGRALGQRLQPRTLARISALAFALAGAWLLATGW